ncbi:hypothetical protein BGZ76_006732 [Entomortierella beljakovae]|nr:hypothetical protein BGZ76_006732 [Entomortierella beljakovae]
MPDYYDSWSANKRRRNPTRSQARLPSDRQWLQELNTPSSNASNLSTIQPSLIAAAVRLPLSPPLPRLANDLSDRKTERKRQVTSTWRFSKSIFDPSSNISHDVDFDDDDDDGGDDDDDDDDGDDDSDSNSDRGCDSDIEKFAGINQVDFKNLYGSARPRLPVIAEPPASALRTSSHRHTVQWASNQPRLLQIQDRHAHANDHVIEQLGSREEIFLESSHVQSNPFFPTPATANTIDNPQSTSTFDPRLYPQQDFHEHILDKKGVILKPRSKRTEGRRPRPWSQVIWESPSLDDITEQHQSFNSNTHGHSATVCSRPQSAYPALAKDFFSPRITPERERAKTISKSVRINIDGDATNTNTNTNTNTSSTIQTTTRGSDGKIKENGHSMNRSASKIPNRREPSNGKRHFNRMSLGTGFYVSIEPISLSTAVPSTPKRKRQLVRLPTRPQSVLIPSTQHSYSSAGLVGQSGQSSQQNVLRRQQTLVLHSLTSEPSKRQRHKSQQLEMGHGTSTAPTSIPWSHLLPMSSRDNAKTFHGIGSSPAAPIPIIKKSGSQEATKGVSDLTSSISESDPLSRFEKQQPEISPNLGWSGKTPKRQSPSIPHHYPPPPASIQALHYIQTPRRLYQPPRESSSSSFSKKQAASNSRHDNSASPLTAKHSSTHTSGVSADITRHLSINPQQQQNIPHHSGFQTRPFNSNNTCTTPSKSRWTFTALKSGIPFSNHRNSNPSNDSNNEYHGDDNVNNNNNEHRGSLPINASSRFAQWKRNTSIFFPFSLVTYESGGLLGEIKNTSTTICTNAQSPIVAPGTPLPPGVIVSKGVPVSPSLASPSSTGSQSESMRIHMRSQPRSAGSNTRQSAANNESGYSSPSISSHEQSSALGPESTCPNCGRDLDGSDSDIEEDSVECECWAYLSSDEDLSEASRNYSKMSGAEDATDATLAIGADDSVVIQKSHVAVYEINPRWGSRLLMILVTIGGFMCASAGSLCAEYHCQDLQFCQDDHQNHGDWCGPSGVEGAPYLLTVGLSMCIFGIHALSYLRSPISRLVGYSEIDQFL